MRLKFKNSVFPHQKLVLPHFYIQNVEDRVQLQVYKTTEVRVTSFSKFIEEKVRKILGISEPYFRAKMF